MKIFANLHMVLSETKNSRLLCARIYREKQDDITNNQIESNNHETKIKDNTIVGIKT